MSRLLYQLSYAAEPPQALAKAAVKCNYDDTKLMVLCQRPGVGLARLLKLQFQCKNFAVAFMVVKTAFFFRQAFDRSFAKTQ